MRTNADMLTSATSSTYIEWLVRDKLGLTDKEWKTYNFLINSLAKIEFISIHPQDENRASDGLELRKQFTDETGYFLDGTSGLPVKCSMLELLAALAIKVENRLMRNISIGDRTSKWFFIMIENMGCSNITNTNWKYDDENYSRAFQQYRKLWIREHIITIIVIILALFLVPMAIARVYQVKEEIDNADIFKLRR